MEYGVINGRWVGDAAFGRCRRNDRPKQLLPVVHGKSLLRVSFERLSALLPPDRIFVCTSAAHKDRGLAAILTELPPQNLLGEPTGPRHGPTRSAFPAAVLLRRDRRRRSLP